jgi:tetratricopeptide (TPR) repeat protein
LAVACALAFGGMAWAQAPAADATAAAAPEPIDNSALDAPMFYQLLIGELELREGRPDNAYQVVLDAARKSRDEALFRRATEMALQARAGDQALAATQAWRTAVPASADAVRYQLQLLSALNRPADTVEPIRSLIRLTPAAERTTAIASLPRLFARSTDKPQAAKLLEQALQPSLSAPETRVAAEVALGRAWLAAGDATRALDLARRAQAEDPKSEPAALLALELMATTPAAEALVTAHLQAKPDSTPIRMVYARILSGGQRYADAVPQLEAVTRTENAPASAWLTLGALQLELKHPKEAEAVLTQYLQRAANSPASMAEAGDDDDDLVAPAAPDQGITQAYLLLSQAAEQQRDYAKAESWLVKITNPQRALDVQARRASLLAKQGKMKEARALIQRAPEKTAEDARAKLLSEAQLLRDAKMWSEANAVLASANQKFPNDADLLYEQSMMAEKLNRMDEMEKLLRRVIEIKPDYHHAYNALGYSLAERNLRLPEARGLIQKALELAPGEPFITDSLGWVEYRMGNKEEALKLLQQAYRSRPDVEIGVHLGEVLWVSGQRDEARKVLRDARTKDGANDVLKETLARLRVDL